MKARLIKSWNFKEVGIKEGVEVNIIKGMEADAAYSMLCWAIENKFVETNKNE